MFVKGLGHINPIAVMEKVDTLDFLVLPIGVSLIEIGPNAVNRLRLDFQLMFCLHNLRS